MKDVLIYCDEGVGPHSFKQTMKGLKEVLSPASYRLVPVNHAYFTSEEWEKNTALIVFPGGRDLPYHHHLRGHANQRIARYVSNGGTYLGICAGAYYGSAMVEFEKGSPLEIIEARELAFFPGTACGPAYGNNLFCYESESGAKIAPVKWIENGEITPLYYNGGCHFVKAHEHKNVSLLATYEDMDLSAVILCQVGSGRALLSGVHPEYSPSLMKGKDPLSKALVLALKKSETERRIFWKRLISNVLQTEV